MNMTVDARVGLVYAEQGERQLMHAGLLMLDLTSRRVEWRGNDVYLTSKQVNLIEFLVRDLGHFHTFEECYIAMRGDRFRQHDIIRMRSNIRSVIRRIRDRFVAFDNQFDMIETYSGFGYRWRHHIERYPEAPPLEVVNPPQE